MVGSFSKFYLLKYVQNFVGIKFVCKRYSHDTVLKTFFALEFSLIKYRSCVEFTK